MDPKGKYRLSACLSLAGQGNHHPAGEVKGPVGNDFTHGPKSPHTAGTYRQTPVPTPVFHNGILYLSRGYRNSDFLALRRNGHASIGAVDELHVEQRLEILNRSAEGRLRDETVRSGAAEVLRICKRDEIAQLFGRWESLRIHTGNIIVKSDQRNWNIQFYK